MSSASLIFSYLILGQPQKDVALGDVRSLVNQLGDDRAVLQAIADLDLVQRRQLAGGGHADLEGAPLDNVLISLDGPARPVAAATHDHRDHADQRDGHEDRDDQERRPTTPLIH